MNAFRKCKYLALVAGSIFLSSPPVFAEDIEIYLYQNEGSGANILLLIDNSGGTNRNFPGDSTLELEYPEKAPVKTIDEIIYAISGTVGGLDGVHRIGVAAQLAGGDNGGAIYYPVKQLEETVSPSGYANVSNNFDEAGQQVDFGGAAFPQTSSGGTWSNFVQAGKLQFPSQLSSAAGQNNHVLAVTLSGLGVPRFAKVDSATLRFSTPDDRSNKFKALVAFENNPAPAAMSDLSALTWSQPFDTGYNAEGAYTDNTLEIDVTAVVQAAVANKMWCGNQELRLLIMASSLSAPNAPVVYTHRAEDATTNARLGKTELDVKWNASDKVAGTESYEGDDAKSCMKDFTVEIGSRNDDAIETEAGSNLVVDGTELLLQNITNGPTNERGNYIAGARFTGLKFAKGTKVTRATLSGRITSMPETPPEITVWGLLGDIAEFTEDSKISSHTKTSQSATYSPSTTGDFDPSIDITGVINEIFNNDSWAAGNSLGLRIERTKGASVGIHAVDGGATGGLSITMDVLAENPSEFGASYDRQNDLKLAVERFSNNTGGGKNKPISAYVEAAKYMLGEEPVFGELQSHIDAFQNPRIDYLSPSEDYNSCGGNHIIMVTHAESSGESFQSQVNDLIDGNPLGKNLEGEEIACTGDSNADAWNCGEALSAFLSLKDIRTHTIAFKPQQETTITGLQHISQAGNGVSQTAANAEELKEELDKLISDLTTRDASMAAPGVAVNQLNRFSHLDQLYYALFRPDFKSRWIGNLKRYAIDFDAKTIEDRKGVAAVGDDGFFKEGTSSWWDTSAEGDGGDVSLGGSKARTLANANRKLLVSRSSPAPSGSNTATSKVTGQTLDVISTIDDVSKAELGLTDTADYTYTDADLQEHLDFLLTEWGDPLHSEPRLVNYGYSATSFEEAALDASKQDNVVFVATNDGMLHAINPNDGSEYFAYIPGEELKKTGSRYSPVDLDAADPRRTTYGLDGGITVWRRSNTDPSKNPEHVFLYVGQRRGGSAYYAIDATDKTNPKLMWKIDATQSDFSNLGQTWSTPTLTQVSLGGTPVPVLVFGGGYSPTEHDDKTKVSTGDTSGNSLFMVNAFTGKLIWSASDSDNTDMKWAIPAPVSAVDVDFDGFVDHLYAADLGGQVFRVDINKANSGTNDLVDRVTTLAKLGTSVDSASDGNRRFYAAPVVAINARSDGTKFLQVAIGSGYRTYPLDEQTTNYIYVVEDYDALSGTSSAALTPDNLLDVTSNTSPAESDFNGYKGWMIELQGSGEKVLSSAVVSSGVMYVTSYLPDSVYEDACSRVVGSSRLYAVNVIDGSPALDFNNDGSLERSTDIQLPGLPPSPQVLLDGSDETTLIIGTEALQGGDLNAGKGVRKTRWFQVDSKTEADAALEK